jgi:hypothetical protein
MDNQVNVPLKGQSHEMVMAIFDVVKKVRIEQVRTAACLYFICKKAPPFLSLIVKTVHGIFVC